VPAEVSPDVPPNSEPGIAQQIKIKAKKGWSVLHLLLLD
jgi:hypothetical protein